MIDQRGRGRGCAGWLPCGSLDLGCWRRVIGSFQSCELLNQRRYWGVIDLQGFGWHLHLTLVRSQLHRRVIGSRLASLLGSADLESVW
jgi:hypothetical protein